MIVLLRILQEFRRGTVVRSMAQEFGPTPATRHAGTLSRLTDAQLMGMPAGLRDGGGPVASGANMPPGLGNQLPLGATRGSSRALDGVTA